MASEAVLVDSNVILDLFIRDARWLDWSAHALATVKHERCVINPVIYAEVSVHFSESDQLDAALPEHEFAREAIPFPAAFIAGKAFLEYRRRGGVRTSPLPDFFIGAHAAVAGYRLLTRDPVRYRSYFPKLALIAP